MKIEDIDEKIVKALKVKFVGMKERCYNPKTKAYQYYGARGITICDEWLNDVDTFIVWSVENGFKLDLNDKNRNRLSIDRKNNDKNYSPENCRYTTSQVQARNKFNRKTNTSGYKGVTKLLHNRSGYEIRSYHNGKKMYFGTVQVREIGAVIYDLQLVLKGSEGYKNFKSDESLLNKAIFYLLEADKYLSDKVISDAFM